jgi:hypothetical protein
MVDKNLWLPSRLTFPAIGAKTDRGPDDIAFFNFYKHILGSEKGHITSLSISGVIEKNAKYFNSKLINMGGRLIHKSIADNSTIYSFHWNEALFDINYQTNGTVYINGISISEKLINDISELFKKHFTTKSKQGYIFAILRQGSSLMMQKVGFAGIPLIKENYKNEVIEDFHHIIKDLKSPSPSGRIAIFDGPMGSGKTHLIRGLLMEVPSALFVLVPPAMVSSIGGPEILPMLLQHKENYGRTGPIIFILEDADTCLAPRMADNMDDITSILNMGDGIFGSLFDIRIVATTNAKQEEMDEAITRPGRLSKRVYVGFTNYEEANRIFQRLLPGQMMPEPVSDEDDRYSMKPRNKKTSFSLAEIYKAARDSGWEPKEFDEDSHNKPILQENSPDYTDDYDDE